MTSSSFTAPTKVCPNCGVQAQTTDDKCPSCNKKYKKKGKALKILLIIGLLLLLAIGGCVALIGGVANEASKSIEKDENKPGGTNNPLTITPGQAFEVDGFNYAAGWRVGKDALDDLAIKGLKVTNNREDRDNALVEIKFFRGTEVLALAGCTTGGPRDPITVGTTVTLDCTSTDKLPTKYDKITINDLF